MLVLRPFIDICFLNFKSRQFLTFMDFSSFFEFSKLIDHFSDYALVVRSRGKQYFLLKLNFQRQQQKENNQPDNN